MNGSVKNVWFLLILFIAVSIIAGPSSAEEITPEQMKAIYEEAKTPYKYGIILEPPENKSVDCPNVFRYGDKWYLVYVRLEKDSNNKTLGYTTRLAVSDDLLGWQPLGTILPAGAEGTWDQCNAGGGISLFDTTWGGSNTLQTYEGRYWLSYLGGPHPGYETPPLFIGVASTDDPSKAKPWQKLPSPVLKTTDADVRPFERETLYKSYIFRDPDKSLGSEFVMFYNAKPHRGSERIGIAISDDMISWKRYGENFVLENKHPTDEKRGVISGDPQIVRMNNLWVMFYFGAFWKDGAFDTFAASRDLVHWTKWDGPDLIGPSESWDKTFAHKPWILKHDGVVYHFYCAVGDKGRAIGLATSKDMKRQEP